jgi:hypothetical protein
MDEKTADVESLAKEELEEHLGRRLLVVDNADVKKLIFHGVSLAN